MKALVIRTAAFFCFTLLLIVSRTSKSSDYINTLSNTRYYDISSEGFKSTIYFTEIHHGEFICHYNFNEVDDSIHIQNFQLLIDKGSYKEIKCFNGKNLSGSAFKTFSEIPESARLIKSNEVEPYYTFDFYYLINEHQTPLKVNINLDYAWQGQTYELNESYEYKLETSWSISEIGHSDIIYLLIIPSSVVTFILILILIFKIRKKKNGFY